VYPTHLAGSTCTMDTWVTSSSSMSPNAVADVRPAYAKKAALLDAAFTPGSNR
jgi:hypothetical protein